MSYSLRIEARDRQESAATDWIEDEPAAALGDDDAETSVLRFSAGNPRVEHVTGVVHLYRHFNSTVQVGGCVSACKCTLGYYAAPFFQPLRWNEKGRGRMHVPALQPLLC